MTTQTPPLARPPDLSGASGYPWGGMTVPRNIWDAVRAAVAGTNVSVPGVAGSSRGQVPPALLLAITEHENASYFTSTPNAQSGVVNPNPSYNYQGHEDSWGPLQLATFGVGSGHSRQELSDPATNYAIGAKAIQNNATKILATNPTISDNDLWAQAIQPDWTTAPQDIQVYEAYPTLTGSSGTDAALPLIPPTQVPGDTTNPLTGIPDAINNFTTGIQQTANTIVADIQLWGFKTLLALVGIGFIALGLWQLPQVRSAVKTTTKAAASTI